MNSIIKGSLVAVALFGFAGIASAANFSNVEFENGDVEIQAKGGSTVEATLRIVVDDGEVVEMLQTDVMGDNLGPVCKSVGGSKGLEEGTHYVDVDVKMPPNTGSYDLEVQGSGIFGGQRSIDCEDDVVGSNSFSDALRVVGSQTNDDDDDNLGGDDDTMPAWLVALFAALGIDINNPKPPTPTKPVFCASMPVYAGYNRLAVQTWLMSNGFSGPFNAVGIYSVAQLNGSNVIWGSASATAYGQAQQACQ